MASLLVAFVAAYLGIGLLFALPFAWRGAGRVDSAAQGSPIGFRLLILPGAAALWPFLALKWAGAAKGARP